MKCKKCGEPIIGPNSTGICIPCLAGAASPQKDKTISDVLDIIRPATKILASTLTFPMIVYADDEEMKNKLDENTEIALTGVIAGVLSKLEQIERKIDEINSRSL